MIVGVVVAMTGVVHFQPASAQTPQTLGIRLLDGPASHADDPRYRAYIVDHMAPSATIRRHIEVSNHSDAPQRVKLYAAAAQVTHGDWVVSDGHARNELTGWTKVEPATMRLGPGATGEAPGPVAGARRATAAEHYGVVWAEIRAAPPAGGGITTVNRVGIRMYVSIGPGGEPPTDFKILSLQTRRTEDGSPVLAARVHNTGRRAVDLTGQLWLAGGPGGVTAGPFTATAGTTLGIHETEPVEFSLDKELPVGPWDARVELSSGLTTREASARVTFPSSTSVAAQTFDADEAQTDDEWSPPLLALLGGAVAMACVAAGAFGIRSRRRRSTVR